MNCSEWNNIVVDHIDGFLRGQIQRDADDHIEVCLNCKNRFQHYLTLSHQIAQIPKNTLPLTIKKDPEKNSFVENIFRFNLKKIRESWKETPWIVRTLSETAAVLTAVIFAILVIPKVREVYEKRMEKQLDALQLEQIAYDYKKTKDPTDATLAPLERSQSTGTESLSGTEGELESDSESDSEESTTSMVTAGKGQIWRFIIRTDSPKEVRPKIIQTLIDLKIPKETKGLGGLEAPGGIEFDLYIPTETAGELKTRLEKLSEIISAPENLPAGTDMLTWYKLKSKVPVPAGKTRLIIWISQI